jgi:hypothetical protein
MSDTIVTFLKIALSSCYTSIIELDSARDRSRRDIATHFSLLNRLNKEVSGWL